MKQNDKIPGWLQALIYIGGAVLIVYLLARLFDFLFNTKAHNEKTRRIFISHSWKYDGAYRTLIKRFDYYGFEYYNHSISEEKALDAETSRKIENGIRNKIRGCSKVLILGGKYANNYWIKKEVKIANELGKEVIVIRPWGANSIPTYLLDNADQVVGFNAKTIIELIKEERNN